MPNSKLADFLDDNHVDYVTINHPPAYAADEIAVSASLPVKEIAKTVIVKVEGRMMMAVLPATHRIKLRKLQNALGGRSVELATEQEITDIFPGCTLGAMPPFGILWGMDVCVARKLKEDEQIAFNASNHTELIQLAYDDFERLVHPTVLEFT